MVKKMQVKEYKIGDELNKADYLFINYNHLNDEAYIILDCDYSITVFNGIFYAFYKDFLKFRVKVEDINFMFTF